MIEKFQQAKTMLFLHIIGSGTCRFQFYILLCDNIKNGFIKGNFYGQHILSFPHQLTGNMYFFLPPILRKNIMAKIREIVQIIKIISQKFLQIAELLL